MAATARPLTWDAQDGTCVLSNIPRLKRNIVAVLKHMFAYANGDGADDARAQAYRELHVAHAAFLDVMRYIMRSIEDKYELRGSVDDTAGLDNDNDDGQRFAHALAVCMVIWEIDPANRDGCFLWAIYDPMRPFMRFITKHAMAHNNSITSRDVRMVSDDVCRFITDIIETHLLRRAACSTIEDAVTLPIIQIAASTLRKIE